ncbi:MAG: MFS transporter [Solirubrobacteraceae bacterium]
MISVAVFAVLALILAARLLGAALFGAMLLLPLYYQVDRGESALSAGLLMAPQGIGAALVMPFSGRLTDRVGGGRVALFGIVVMTLATLPLVGVGPTTSYTWLALVLLVRGIGLGFSMMPTMASAYAVLERDQVPGATSVLNTLQRLGGSVGTALLAVVLADQTRAVLGSAAAGSGGLIQTLSPTLRANVAAPLATAFGKTFWWAFAASLVALIPAGVLALTQRRERRWVAAAAGDPTTSAAPPASSRPRLGQDLAHAGDARARKSRFASAVGTGWTASRRVGGGRRRG